MVSNKSALRVVRPTPLPAPVRLVVNGHRRHRPQQIVGERRIGELKMTLVVELEQGRRERMVLLQVQIVHFRFTCRVATLFADIHLEKRKHKIQLHSTPTFLHLSLPSFVAPCTHTDAERRAPSDSATPANNAA